MSGITFDPLAPIMSPSVHLPHYKLLESPNSRSILIGRWKITAQTNPISNQGESDHLQNQLGDEEGTGIPLPEMCFGNNLLKLEWREAGFLKDHDKESKVSSDTEDDLDADGDTWMYQFDTLHALLGVKKGQMEDGDGGVKVEYADKWMKSRSGPSPLLPMPKTVPTKPYDWTYTTTYPGHCSATASSKSDSPSSHWLPANPTIPSQIIPLSELTRPDPILFYAEVPLFEDELHDNGSSGVIVRLRVMPTCIFILARFTLRVDGVLFRTFDTRIYSSLERDLQNKTPIVIRETSGWEAPYESIKVRLPTRTDLTPLTDPGWIAKILTELPSSQTNGAGTGWRGLGKKCEWISVS
ncbi:TIP41-like family-domain-containing protein [Rhodocollybia butyracea]|uniref:TIP41-like family-domain-containing protein n=1 Tax=Rhodocollybia butyracea TaxID=206335 RepID=A0A9P5QBP7_9AGAR|nr:TIP41-like family-domain-containing protein [Rhodocollybia butyracea]